MSNYPIYALFHLDENYHFNWLCLFCYCVLFSLGWNLVRRMGGTRNFRRGADSSDKGLKYDFQGTISAKNLRNIVFHL